MTAPAPTRRPRRVAILGATGSVGASALDVCAALPDRLQVVGLTAHSQWQKLAAACHRVRRVGETGETGAVESGRTGETGSGRDGSRRVGLSGESGSLVAVLTDPEAFAAADRSAFPAGTQLKGGPDAACDLARAPDVDVVLAAVVGVAGLGGTWAALEAGKTVALANKESLVVGGSLVTALAAKTGARILPVDSEHSAIFQALTGHTSADLTRVVLTASGGPFRTKSAAELRAVTPADALRHPTWQMGPKITIDSATMMNKALELIEARWLFDLRPDQLAVVVHPESVVHSFVEFADGSVLAQLSPPDMRLPVQVALLHPERVPGPANRLDWHSLRSLTFEPPDTERFPALALGFEVAARGGSCGAVLNGANEAAVGLFLGGKMAFPDIPACCRAVLDAHDFDPAPGLDRLAALDRWARQEVARWIRLQQ